MIIVDTSVWVDYLRAGGSGVDLLLRRCAVLIHPFVVGELACWGLPRRSEVFALMARLPRADIAEHDEVLSLVEEKRLAGLGIGWVDAHLLASAMLSDAGVWTRDGGMARAALRLGVFVSGP